MIVADTSALIALLKGEPEAEAFLRTMRAAGPVIVGAPTRFEFLLVAAGLRSGAEEDAQRLLAQLAIETLDWSSTHSDLAIQAFLRFGKGRHPAGLNFGDCMAYAIARSVGAPLLFKGKDFAMTDVATIDPVAE